MGGKTQEIAVEFAHVHRNLTGRLRRVEVEQRPGGVNPPRQFGNAGEQFAGFVAGEIEGDQPCAVLQDFLQFRRIGQPGAERPGRAVDRSVFMPGDQEAAPARPLQYGVVALGGAAGENQLVNFRSDAPGDLCRGLFDRLQRPQAESVTAGGIAELLPEKREHRVNHRLPARRRGVEIAIDHWKERSQSLNTGTMPCLRIPAQTCSTLDWSFIENWPRFLPSRWS